MTTQSPDATEQVADDTGCPPHCCCCGVGEPCCDCGMVRPSASCIGEICFCGQPAAKKVGEEIPHDDPMPNRHNLTRYVCASHYAQIMGPLGAKQVGLASLPSNATTNASLVEALDEIAELSDVAKGCARREAQFFADRKSLITALKRVKIMVNGVVDRRFNEQSQCNKVSRINEYTDAALATYRESVK